MRIATLITWLFTVSVGAYMLRTWIARARPARPAEPARPARRGAGDALPPPVVYGHASLALTGLAVWISYVAAGWTALAWVAAGLLTPVVGLGLAMVTLWTPYPVPASGAAGPAVGGMLATPAPDALAGGLTDEILRRALTDDALAGRLADEVLASVPAGPAPAGKSSRGYLAPLVPAVHGVAALTTVFLALLTAVSAR